MAFKPLHTTNSTSQNYGQVNDMVRQLNREQVAKAFKQPGGNNALITGKLPFETDSGAPAYGTLYYDSDGTPSIIIGILPDNSIGLVIAKPGENVLDVFV